jgi:hypothetical protein
MGSCSSSQNSKIINSEHSSLVVITSIFNPVGYKTRNELYHRFANHINSFHIRLITIECVFPEQKFQIAQANNPDHIQIHSKDILWVKENLINIAARRLPAQVKYIVWADADILFTDKNWVNYTIETLKSHRVVQLFESCDFLGPNNKDVLRRDYSLGYSFVHKKPIDQKKYQEWYPHPGYVWAMKKNDFLQMNGLFEKSLVGSADLHFAFAILPGNRVKETIPETVDQEYKDSVIEWAETVNSVVQGKIGYIPVKIQHLFHGDRENRQYMSRWNIVVKHHWKPNSYLIPNSKGLLQFNPDYYQQTKPIQSQMIQYFKNRLEDSTQIKMKQVKPGTESKQDDCNDPATVQYHNDHSNGIAFINSSEAANDNYFWSSAATPAIDTGNNYNDSNGHNHHHHHNNNNDNNNHSGVIIRDNIDVNRDGVVDCRDDFNKDGVVDYRDYNDYNNYTSNNFDQNTFSSYPNY